MMLELVLRIVLGSLLFLSSILKLPDVKGFAKIILMYGMFDYQTSKVFAWFVVLGELVTAMLLFTGPVRLASILALGFLGMATGGVLYALIKGNRMSNCGCYGTAFKVPLNWRKLLENLVWVFLALALVVVAW